MKKLLALIMTAAIACTALGCAAAFAGCGGDEPEPDPEEQTVGVTMLTMANPPDKTTYEEGEYFDSTGLVVNATLEDGTIEENVAYTVKTKDAFTIESSNKTTQSVQVSYGGKTLNITVTVTYKGNNAQYSVANFAANDTSALSGKTFLFLGSSVTYGYGSEGEAVADYLAKADGCTCIKEAVSGTTLKDVENVSGKSYVTRLEEYIESTDKAGSLDAFVCQLSTNDMYDGDTLGTVSETKKATTEFTDDEKQTTYGAIEYICALVEETWEGCPIVFYTSANPNNQLSNVNYKAMVTALESISEVYGITVLDLYNDDDFNTLTDDQYDLYMTDNVHPTKAGYSLWWLPKFESCLESVLSAD